VFVEWSGDKGNDTPLSAKVGIKAEHVTVVGSLFASSTQNGALIEQLIYARNSARFSSDASISLRMFTDST